MTITETDREGAAIAQENDSPAQIAAMKGRAAFKVIRPSDGHAMEVYADGQTKGFPDDYTILVNSIPLLLHAAVAEERVRASAGAADREARMRVLERENDRLGDMALQAKKAANEAMNRTGAIQGVYFELLCAIDVSGALLPRLAFDGSDVVWMDREALLALVAKRRDEIAALARRSAEMEKGDRGGALERPKSALTTLELIEHLERRVARIETAEHAEHATPPRLISDSYFRERVGRGPVGDELERCNCPVVGRPGHTMCGWDWVGDLPRFLSTQ